MTELPEQHETGVARHGDRWFGYCTAWRGCDWVGPTRRFRWRARWDAAAHTARRPRAARP